MLKLRCRFILRSAALALCAALITGCMGGLGRGEVTCYPAPSITGSPAAVATVGYPYFAVFSGAYNCGLSMCFSIEAVSLPAGAVIDNSVKAVLWTPQPGQEGFTHTLAVRTSPDACGASAGFQWTVQVQPAPEIQSFTARPAVLHPGQTSQLTAVFSGGYGNLATGAGVALGDMTSGVPFTTEPLFSDTVFVLTVGNTLGAMATRQLTVLAPGAPVIGFFNASAPLVTQGQPVTLSWSAGSGATLRLDPGAFDVTGLAALVVTLAADTTYTLTASNLLGESVQASTPVQVVPAPVIDAFAAVPAATTLGGQVTLTAGFRFGTGAVGGFGAVQPGVGVLTPPLLGTTTFVLEVTNAAGSVAAQTVTVPVTGPGTFQAPAADPLHLRSDHSATLLPDGRVLLAGGQGLPGTGDGTELFDPAAGTFTEGPKLLAERAYHQAVLLPGGKVLLAGGIGPGGDLLTAEVVDPAGASVPAGTLARPTQRGCASAPLPGGDAFFLLRYGAARYLGASGSFSDLGGLASDLGSVSALQDGRLLIINLPSWIFDPAAGTFTDVGSPVTPAFLSPMAVTLPDGRVFASWDGSAQLWDPALGTFTPAGATGLGQGITGVAALLPGARVLLLQPDGTRVYDAASGTFQPTGTLAAPRARCTATPLLDGRVLVTGGVLAGTPAYCRHAEIYTP